MPAHTKADATMVTRVLQMQRAGASAREIADALGIAKNTVIKWLRDRGLEPNGGLGPRNTRPPRAPAPAVEAVQEAAEAEVADIVIDPASLNVDTVLENAKRRHEQFRAAVDQNFQAAVKGHFPMQRIERLAIMEQKYATTIGDLTPEPPADPETDPTNHEAAMRVTARVEALVEQAERDARCQHCGKAPFPVGPKAA